MNHEIYLKTTMKTSISSDAVLNYKKDTWKMKVKNIRTKIPNSPKNHETFEHIFESFTFISFVA